MGERVIHSFTTAKNGPGKMVRDKDIVFRSDIEEQENSLLIIYPQMRYQQLKGFGGAITDAAALIWKKLSPKTQQELVNACFGRDGLRYTICRSHIQSCDFTLGNYAYIQSNDDTLETFSIAHDKEHVIPMIKAAMAASEQGIRVMSSPWSPPDFMKTNGRMNNGGKLKKEYYAAWARLIAKYIRAYRDEGIPIYAISAQNETHAAQKWESCVYSIQEEMEFIGRFLGPILKEEGLNDVKIYYWDHNKERALDRTAVLMQDVDFSRTVAGIALHWYSGDHFEAMKMLHEMYPGLDIMLTEYCQEAFTDCPSWDHPERVAHEIIGDLNNFATACIDWNIVLDDHGGPTHIGNFCNAPIIAHVEEDRLEYRASYDYIGHFSRFLHPGAVRLGRSCYTDMLETTAFQNTDGSTVVLVLNRTDRELPFTLKYGNMIADLSMGQHSIKTLVF